MQFIRHAYRRNRSHLKTLGWAAAGFVLVFCVLTVQLSATEGRSFRQRTSPATFHTQPLAKPQAEVPSSQAHLRFAKVQQNQQQVIHPTLPSNTGSTQASQVIENAHPFFSPGEFVESLPQPMQNHTSSAPVEYLQEEIVSDPTYPEQLSTPRSNYFGISPDEYCDEWSGFCGCEQKMFDRGCRSCGTKNLRSRR